VPLIGAEQRDLRVRTTDPTAGVAPPEHGERKAKVYLYPSEGAGGAHPRDPPTRRQRHFLVSPRAEKAGAIRPDLLFGTAS
jgi:hypothetical protein